MWSLPEAPSHAVPIRVGKVGAESLEAVLLCLGEQ